MIFRHLEGAAAELAERLILNGRAGVAVPDRGTVDLLCRAYEKIPGAVPYLATVRHVPLYRRTNPERRLMVTFEAKIPEGEPARGSNKQKAKQHNE